MNQNPQADAILEMLKVLTLVEIQLSYNHAPDAAMQKVMLASVRAAILKAKSSGINYLLKSTGGTNHDH